MPPTQKAHQIQLPAIPCFATTPHTNRGVSAANVVATIDVPASHQDTSRPDVGPCGDVMPQLSDALCKSGTSGPPKFNIIAQWVKNGALKN